MGSASSVEVFQEVIPLCLRRSRQTSSLYEFNPIVKRELVFRWYLPHVRLGKPRILQIDT